MEKGSLGTELCHPEGGETHKVKLFLLPAPVCAVLDLFLLRWCARISLLDSGTSQKLSHLWVIVQVRARQGLLKLTERDQIASQATLGSKAMTEICLPIT